MSVSRFSYTRTGNHSELSLPQLRPAQRSQKNTPIPATDQTIMFIMMAHLAKIAPRQKQQRNLKNYYLLGPSHSLFIVHCTASSFFWISFSFSFLLLSFIIWNQWKYYTLPIFSTFRHDNQNSICYLRAAMNLTISQLYNPDHLQLIACCENKSITRILTIKLSL